MANAPFGQFPGDFESLARQYWNTWNELLGRGSSFDAWGLAGGMPPGLGGMDPGTYDWYQRMQRLAADFSGGGRAPDIARAWREMLDVQGTDAFGGLLRSMHGGLAGGAWLEQIRPLLDMLLRPLREQSAEWLQRPAFGPAREHQERLQALALAWQEWEQRNEAFNAVLAQAVESAHARFEKLLGQHDAPGKRLESARALFDLWIDAAEEAWAEIALSDEYRHVYAEMTNALMRLRLGLQREVEQFGTLLGLPGRSELDALHRKVADLERSLHAARRGKPVQAARTAPPPRARRAAAAVEPVADPVVEKAAAAVAPSKSTRKPARSPARKKAVAKRPSLRKPMPANTKKADRKADRATSRPAAVRSVAATTAVKAVEAKRASAGAKQAQATTADATPRVSMATPEKKAAKAAARVAAAKPAAAGVQSTTATASRKPAAVAPVERKAGVRNGTRAARTASTRAPATAKVVSMKDWVSRNLGEKEPAGKGKSGGRRGGRDR
ncbi:MAG: hypothetical protein J7507_09790 [Pseudoxanthomonas sp.]|nr:hypothetical protein [Pseudoxanthomonas sp.]